MATLILNRGNEYANFLRDYRIFINGKFSRKISNNKTEIFDLPQGEYNLIAKIDWCSSNELDMILTEGDSLELKVSGMKYSRWLIPCMIVYTLICYFILYYFQNSVLLIVLLFPLLIYVVYYLTFGRKKYLTLKFTNRKPKNNDQSKC